MNVTLFKVVIILPKHCCLPFFYSTESSGFRVKVVGLLYLFISCWIYRKVVLREAKKRIMKTVNETITKQQANLCWNTSLSKFQLIYLTFKNMPGSNFVLPSWSQCPLIWAREDNLTQMVNRLSFPVFMVKKWWSTEQQSPWAETSSQNIWNTMPLH